MDDMLERAGVKEQSHDDYWALGAFMLPGPTEIAHDAEYIVGAEVAQWKKPDGSFSRYQWASQKYR